MSNYLNAAIRINSVSEILTDHQWFRFTIISSKSTFGDIMERAQGKKNCLMAHYVLQNKIH